MQFYFFILVNWLNSNNKNIILASITGHLPADVFGVQGEITERQREGKMRSISAKYGQL